MSAGKTLATASRVLRQLRHDRRTIALILVIPPLLLALLKYVFAGQAQTFNAIAPPLLGVFPIIMMFLITSIATLRERRGGTLERLMTMPISKLDFIMGYAIAFSLVAAVQAAITALVLVYPLGVEIAGGTWLAILGAVLSALLGTALGLFASALARTEFQVIQFMPAFILPQLLLCGLFVARDQMSDVLEWISNILPLTYSVDLLQQISWHAEWSNRHTTDIVVIVAATIAALLLGAVTIRRRG